MPHRIELEMTKIKFGTDGWRAIIAKEYTVKHKLLIAPRSTSQVSAQESAAPGKEIHDITCFPLETATSSNEKEKSIGKTTPVVWATTSRNCYPTDPADLSPVQCGEPLRVGKCTEHQECQEYFAYPTCTACIDQFWFPQPWPTTPRTIIRILPACGSHNASHIPAYGTCHMNLYTLSSERSHPHSQLDPQGDLQKSYMFDESREQPPKNTLALLTPPTTQLTIKLLIACSEGFNALGTT